MQFRRCKHIFISKASPRTESGAVHTGAMGAIAPQLLLCICDTELAPRMVRITPEATYVEQGEILAKNADIVNDENRIPYSIDRTDDDFTTYSLTIHRADCEISDEARKRTITQESEMMQKYFNDTFHVSALVMLSTLCEDMTSSHAINETELDKIPTCSCELYLKACDAGIYRIQIKYGKPEKDIHFNTGKDFKRQTKSLNHTKIPMNVKIIGGVE